MYSTIAQSGSSLTNPMDRIPRVEIFGLPIAACTMNQTLDLVRDRLETREPLNIGVVNAAKLVLMQKDHELREAVQDSNLILADGMSVVWASRILGQPLPERVTGIDLMMEILKLSGPRPIRVFFLGATQEVLDEVCRKVRQEFRGVEIAGAHHGYFDPSDDRTVANLIIQSNADVLFVAMTSPKKERFLAQWSREMKVPITHGVGGSLDVLAGKVRRAPKFWQRVGLEWFFRLKEEPRRLWKRYLVTNTLFCFLVIEQFVGQIVRRTAHSKVTRRAKPA